MPGDGDPAWLGRMLEMPMAALLSNQTPAFRPNQSYHIPDCHGRDIRQGTLRLALGRLGLEQFGGGGHTKAAGAFLHESLEAAQTKVLDAVRAAMQ